MLAWIEAVVDGLGDAIGWLIVSAAAIVGEAGRRIWKLEKRTREATDDVQHLDDRVETVESRVLDVEEEVARTRRYLVGDKDDPSQPGLLDEVHGVKADVNRLDEKIDKNHQEMSQKLDRLIDGDD